MIRHSPRLPAAAFLALALLAPAILAAAPDASAQAAPLDREALLAHALASSADARSAARSLEAAKDALLSENLLLQSKLNASGSYSAALVEQAGPGGGQASDSLSGSAGLSATIIPGLSASASVSAKLGSSDLGYKLNLSYRPFTDQGSMSSAQAKYDAALLQAQDAERKLKATVYKAYADWIKAGADLSKANTDLSSKERAQETASIKYDAGNLSLADLEKARSDVFTAQQTLYNAETTELDKRIALLSACGYQDKLVSEPDFIEKTQLSSDPGLDRSALEKKAAAILAAGTAPHHAADLAIAERDLALLLAKSPLSSGPLSALSLSASWDGKNLGASLSWDSSLLSFTGKDARSRQRDIEAARDKILSLKASQTANDQKALFSLTQALRKVESAATQLSQAEKTLADQKLKHDSGASSALNLETAANTRDQAEASLLAAYLDLEYALLDWD
jgi:hypothetical protein